jgi:hypothetical protein
MTSERRRHARIPLCVQVAITRVDQVHQLEAIDVSKGGLFLEGDPDELPEFVVGAELSMRLFDCDSELERADDEDILAMGRIVRVERGDGGPRPSGFAVAFTELGDEDQARLDALLARVTAGRAQA